MKLRKLFLAAVLCAALLFPVPAADAAAAQNEVILGGMPFGLTMYTNGVVVVEVDDSEDSPAHEAGIRENDVITKANGMEITTNEELKTIISTSQGEDIELSLSRGESPISLSITPVKNDDGRYEVGMWIRDSAAGLGTVTFFDAGTRTFGALGHGVCDRDTGLLLPLKQGKLLSAQVTSATKAQKGVAGGLNGYMTDEILGEITVNTGFGIFGRYTVQPEGERLACADNDEIERGKATLYCTADAGGVMPYDVEIEKIDTSSNTGQNMIIRVTDEELLEKTGGIVQGMSGSPIVQNGKLIGAVTHVFVNTPQTGYAISIENMRSAAT